MNIPFTKTQIQRLIELDASPETYEGIAFDTEAEREQVFRKVQRDYVAANKARLEKLRLGIRRPALRRVETTLVDHLTQAGFVEVVTPTTLSKGMLTKMGIDESHPLWEQVFWIGKKACLRPMLAPNLYHLMGYLPGLWPYPVRFFEVGPCFRKESKGSKHLSEFTMLNLVEMGIEDAPEARLEALSYLVMSALGLEYRIENETSEVYGSTTDILVGDVEIASGACGPHPLDANWNIADNWVGLGVGLERVVMIVEGFRNIRRAGRSLIYMDGARLNI